MTVTAASQTVLTASQNEARLRLDVFLHQKTGLSRARFQKLIKEKMVLVDGEVCRASHRLKAGAKVSFTIPPEKEIKAKPQKIALEIIYEDQDLVVVNKPKGMVVHPAAGNYAGTLVNALLYHIKGWVGVGGSLRPGIVHRLDKDTSGVMVVAKNDLAQESLSRQFKEHTVKKTYWAVVHGIPKLRSGTIETLFGRHPKNRKKMAVLGSSKFNVQSAKFPAPPTLNIEHRTSNFQHRVAITKYKVIKTAGKYSLLEINLETGRTHQIRVHLNHIGCPVVGEQTYGRRENDLGATRQLLHAKKIAFFHPRSKKWVEFEAPLPADFPRDW